MNVSPDQIRMHFAGRPVDPDAREPWDTAAIIDVLRRHLRLVILVPLSCIVLALAYLVTAAPLFTATSTLLIDTKMNLPSPAQASAEGLVDPGAIESQVEILKSDRILGDVVDALKLTSDPEFAGAKPGILADLVGRLFPEPQLAAGPDSARQGAISALGQKIKITRSGRSFLAEIKATTLSPKKSALIANGVAEAYIQDQLNSRAQSTQRTCVWMQHRLSEVRAEADTAGRAVQDYRKEQGIVPGETNDNVTSDKEAMARKLTDARQDSDRARAADNTVSVALEKLKDPKLQAQDLDAIKAVGDADVDTLVAQLRDGASRDAAGLQGAAVAKSKDALLGRLEFLKDQKRKTVSTSELRYSLLARQLEAVSSKLNDAAESSRKLQQLELEAQVARNNYEALLTRVTRVSSFLQQQSVPVTEARIVSPAVPPLSKSAPRFSLVLLLAAVGGVAAGAAGAFLREMFDRRVRWANQISKGLGVTYLGALPAVQRRVFGRLQRITSKWGGLPDFLEGPHASAAAVETLREIKVVIDQTAGRGQCAVVAVVSAVPGEGKSTVAANLAGLVSEMGLRVLLIDADLRGSGLTAALSPSGGTPLPMGIAFEQPLLSCVSKSGDIDVLAGSIEQPPAHPPEILASAGLRRILSEARRGYDYVVIDTPALLGCTDVRALSDVVDAFVLAVLAGKTTTDEIKNAFARCPAVPDRLIGAVLNRSTVTRESRSRPAQAMTGAIFR